MSKLRERERKKKSEPIQFAHFVRPVIRLKFHQKTKKTCRSKKSHKRRMRRSFQDDVSEVINSLFPRLDKLKYPPRDDATFCLKETTSLLWTRIGTVVSLDGAFAPAKSRAIYWLGMKWVERPDEWRRRSSTHLWTNQSTGIIIEPFWIARRPRTF